MPILLVPFPDGVEALLHWLVWKLIPEHAGSMQAVLRPSCVAGVENPPSTLRSILGLRNARFG